MRALLASSEPRAALAVDLFVYRIGRELGSLAAALGGLDALVFTAGIGENAPPIRERVCRDAAWLGVELDAAANARRRPAHQHGRQPRPAWVIPTNEELMIARHTRDSARERLASPRPLATRARSKRRQELDGRSPQAGLARPSTCSSRRRRASS